MYKKRQRILAILTACLMLHGLAEPALAAPFGLQVTVPASAKKTVKVHRGLRYETTNAKVARVTSKGVIRAVAKGKCTVYVYTQNGVYKEIQVTVR